MPRWQRLDLTSDEHAPDWTADPAEVIPELLSLGSRPPWWRHARCRGVGVDVFFPPTGHTYKQAADLCASCRVAQRCLDDALRLPPGDDLGFRAGTTAQQRRALRRIIPEAS